MDLTSLYSDFVMDDKEVLFHSAPGYVSSFHDDEGNMYCAVPAFQHSDADLARDPLSTNRRLVNSEELELFGTMVVAGATSDHIKVLIPDTFSGPTVNANSPVVLQHVVGLTLGPAVDLSSSLPAPNLERALCTKHQVVRAETGRFMYAGVISHHHCWQEIVPVVAMCLREYGQHHEQSTVKPFDQTVTSRMIRSRTCLVCPQQETQLMHEVIFKFATLIRMDYHRHTEATDDQLEKCIHDGNCRLVRQRTGFEKNSQRSQVHTDFPFP